MLRWTNDVHPHLHRSHSGVQQRMLEGTSFGCNPFVVFVKVGRRCLKSGKTGDCSWSAGVPEGWLCISLAQDDCLGARSITHEYSYLPELFRQPGHAARTRFVRRVVVCFMYLYQNVRARRLSRHSHPHLSNTTSHDARESVNYRRSQHHVHYYAVHQRGTSATCSSLEPYAS